jgi:hypothetical protein
MKVLANLFCDFDKEAMILGGEGRGGGGVANSCLYVN